MLKKVKALLFGTVALCGILGGMYYFNNLNATAQTVPLDYEQLKKEYGITFTPSNVNQSNFISAQQALDYVKGQFKTPPTMDATFGYLNNDASNASILIPKHGTNGVVTNYPVWLVRISGLDIPSHGPAVSGNTTNGGASTGPLHDNNTLYEFIDATTGKMLFATALYESN